MKAGMVYVPARTSLYHALRPPIVKIWVPYAAHSVVILPWLKGEAVYHLKDGMER